MNFLHWSTSNFFNVDIETEINLFINAPVYPSIPSRLAGIPVQGASGAGSHVAQVFAKVPTAHNASTNSTRRLISLMSVYNTQTLLWTR